MNYNKLKESEPIQILGHDNADNDSITSMYLFQKLLTYKNIESEIIIPDGKIADEFDFNEYSFEYKRNIDVSHPVFLVDHAATRHSNNIIGYIDHHGKELYENGNYLNKPQSSCAKIIFDEMLREGMVLDKATYYLVVKSVYLDTLSFNSEKAVTSDKIWAYDCCEKYMFNRDKLYNEGLGLVDINSLTSEDLRREYKEFIINGNLLASSGIKLKHLPSRKELDNMINDLKYIKSIDKKDYWLYYISCLEDKCTISIFLNNDSVKITNYDGIKSRGKDLVPEISKLIPKKTEKSDFSSTDEKNR